MGLQVEQILRRCRDLLVDRTAAGSRVFINQAEVDTVDGLPNILLYALSEKLGTYIENSPRRFIRTVNMAVDLKIADPTSDGASLRMNGLAEQVERILLKDIHLHDADGQTNLANEIRWVGAELTLDASSKSIVDGLSISFEVDYLYEPEDEAPADMRPLLALYVGYDLANGDTPDAVDVITLQGG